MNLRPRQKEALAVLAQKDRGIIAKATGSGKTLVQIFDTKRVFDSSTSPKVVVVVAPRILLAAQLSYEYSKHITDARYLHVHTKNGKVKHYHTTNPKIIAEWSNIHQEHHRLIFATYHSLKKIYEAKISIDTVMFDESHNSTSAGFHEYVKKISEVSPRNFHFSASPKFSKNKSVPGMNDPIYGEIIVKASAAEMIKEGHILKPKFISHFIEWVEERTPQNDCQDILNIMNEYNLSQLLINVKSTKNMMNMLSETDFQEKLKDMGYNLLHITSQYGAYFNNKRIDKDQFFKLLDEFGQSSSNKYVILNYSILGEGMNIKSLDAVLLMRNHNLIKLVQTIGRALRISAEDSEAIEKGELEVGNYSNYLKPEGKIIIPVYNKNLLKISESIQKVIDRVYEKGEIPIMVV
jgi:superfamily II DNA or RNA helicase